MTAEQIAEDHPNPCQGYFCEVCFPDDWPGTHENPPRPKPLLHDVRPQSKEDDMALTTLHYMVRIKTDDPAAAGKMLGEKLHGPWAPNIALDSCWLAEVIETPSTA